MKNRILAIVLSVLMLLSMAISTAALDAPAPGGDHIFNADRMTQFTAGTRFHNGIVNGGIINPGTGAYSTYAGVKFAKDTYKGESCVKVELLDDKVTGYFDFNYYQWNADAFEPSLDATKYPYLRVRYAYNEAAADIDCMAFFASKDVEVLGTTAESAMKTWDIANGEGEWMDTVVYVGDLIFGDGFTWSESTVRQFRVQMFEYNENPEAVCYIAGFGFFESEAAAKAYNFGTGSAGTVTPPATQAPVTEAPTTADTTVAVIDTKPVDTSADVEVDASAEDTTAEDVENTEDTTAEDAEDSDATEADDSAETSEEDASAEDTTAEDAEDTTAADAEDTTAEDAEDTTAPAAVDDATEEGGMNVGLIVGIVAAVVVIAAIVIVLLKKKK